MTFLDEPSPLLVRAALVANLRLRPSLTSDGWSQSANRRAELRETTGLPDTRVKPTAAGGCGIIGAMATIPRISFGSASCGAPVARRWPLLRDVCAEVKARIEHLRSLPPNQLEALADEDTEERAIRNRIVRFTTYRTSVGQGETLVVVQAFVRTLLRANYIPLGFGAGVFSGRIVVRGLILTPNGRVAEAPDDLLWAFR
jgi:hypothetical protein